MSNSTTPITAEQYDSWPEERCAGIEIVDGMVIVSPSAATRHNRMARLLANALDAAGSPDAPSHSNSPSTDGPSVIA